MQRSVLLVLAVVSAFLSLAAGPAQAQDAADSCSGPDEPIAAQQPQCTIGGAVYRDANGNAVRDAAEQPMQGVVVYADFNANGGRDLEEPSAQSGFDGSYTVTVSYEHALVSFQLRQEQPSGFFCSQPAPACSYEEQAFLSDIAGEEPELDRAGRDFGNRALPSVHVAGARAFSPGTARLKISRGCAASARRALVSGRGVANVSFFLDGRKLMTVINADSKGRFGYRIKTSKLRAGSHRVRAYVTFTAASATASRTLTAKMQRCRPVKPKFAG